MSAHMSTLALRGQLPKGPCRTCDKHAIKRRQLDCRGSDPLNGEGAAHEFARHLLPSVRAALLDPKPVVRRPPVWQVVARYADRLAPNPTQEPVENTVCPRCHEDAGWHKDKCRHCGVKKGRRLRAVRTYGIKAALEAA